MLVTGKKHIKSTIHYIYFLFKDGIQKSWTYLQKKREGIALIK